MLLNTKRLQYKSSSLSLNVRPYKVAQAAQCLVKSGKLYRDEGITFNDNWLEQNLSHKFFNDSDSVNETLPDCVDNNVKNNDKNHETNSDEDHWSEDEHEDLAGVTDTLLTAPDFTTDNERQCILNIAPGEGNIPISIFRDKYSEELAYPGIFFGHPRPENSDRLTNVRYSDICKSELRRADRRAAMCVEIFFSNVKSFR